MTRSRLQQPGPALAAALVLAAWSAVAALPCPASAEPPAGEPGSRHVFTVEDGKTCLDGRPLRVIGLRCSNALISGATTTQLIENLDTFADYVV